MKRTPRELFIEFRLWTESHKRIAYPLFIGVALILAYLVYRLVITRLLNIHISYNFDFSVFLRQRLTDKSTYLSLLLWGFLTTLRISAISIVLAMVLGTIIAVLKLSKIKVLVFLSSAYIEFFRNTPLLIQIFIWYFGSDPFLPQVVKDWIYSQNIEFAYGVIALSTYTAAFIAEEIRAGIQSIPREQMEAARSQGFTFLESMRYVILPQAFRIVVPPLINQSLNLVKNSSLVMAIGVVELTHVARIIEAETSRVFEAFSMVTLIYLALSLVISFAINQYNRRFLRYIKY
ncbi:MAG: amino acid ABC transporter permease [Deltaproteobacteria bacterium]|nr:amino acid ABC transporter permease [Candidatus Zymogenaceae bacterium]